MMNDLLIDENKDLAFANGDLATGNSDYQHQELLLMTDKGDWKEQPTVAVGVRYWLKDNDAEGLMGEIKQEFERDGMSVKKIEIANDGKLNIDASFT